MVLKKKVQLHNSIGKKQQKKLHFVYVDIRLEDVEHLEEYRKMERDDVDSNPHHNFIGCAIPLKYYPMLCEEINTIMDKGAREGLYYGTGGDKGAWGKKV